MDVITAPHSCCYSEALHRATKDRDILVGKLRACNRKNVALWKALRRMRDEVKLSLVDFDNRRANLIQMADAALAGKGEAC